MRPSGLMKVLIRTTAEISSSSGGVSAKAAETFASMSAAASGKRERDRMAGGTFAHVGSDAKTAASCVPTISVSPADATG